jgi:8-oxo-dGTP diphosphatase
MKRAIGIIIENKKKEILLAKRSANIDEDQGLWENVGGGVEENETHLEAAVREVKEELGCEVIEINEILNYGGEDQKFHIKVFKAVIKGEPKIMEPELCEELRWIKKEDLKNMNLAEYSREDYINLGWIGS